MECLDPNWLAPACNAPAAELPARRAASRRRFTQVRALSEALTRGLSDADASIQPMPDASPAKWHLAHTSWFFESFVLRDHCGAYTPFDARYHYLFNSYYEAEGARLQRHRRGMLSRPALAEILNYRRHVSDAVLAGLEGFTQAALDLLELGCHHEEQHQELLQTDVLNLFAANPLQPAWWPDTPTSTIEPAAPAVITWVTGTAGPVRIGHTGPAFAFDCEKPAHTVWLAPHALASRLVTNQEWRAFIDAGAYRDPTLWLSDGWAWLQREAIEAPLYWRRNAHDEWSAAFGPCGTQALIDAAPVCHVSYYEAEAYARWCGARLPTEAEWEAAASVLNPQAGGFLDSAGPAAPGVAADTPQLQQMFGALWQWTESAFLPYPGFRPAAGAVGEYNGKFMSGQFVLRGGSCATPRGHLRCSYRNFFYPHQRWQYTGVRLARDV